VARDKRHTPVQKFPEIRIITTTSVIGFAGGEPTHDQALRSDDRCNQLDEVERIVTCKVTRILSDTKAKPAPPAPRSARDRPEPFFGCLVDPSGESPDARLISQSGLAKSPCCGFATRSLTGVGGCRHRLFLHAVFDLDPPAIDRSGSLAGNRGNPGRGNHQRDGIAKALNDRGIPTTRGGRRQAVQVQRVLKRAGAATIRDHAG